MSKPKANADLDKIIQRLRVEESCCKTGLLLNADIVVAIQKLRAVLVAEERHQVEHLTSRTPGRARALARRAR